MSYLEETISEFPDPRTGSNTRYTMRDAALAAFSVFFTQSPSFLAHQRSMQLS
ncbi:MAG: ISNCY family transposase, partial [Spirochaetota bacterium]